MNDNDIRVRLAREWLRHQHTGCGCCRCGHRPEQGFTNLEAQAMHVADVLLSLPITDQGLAAAELALDNAISECASLTSCVHAVLAAAVGMKSHE